MNERNNDRVADAWLDDLRVQYVRIASRRVEENDVDDVVQEAMRIVAEKGLDRSSPSVDGLPPLAWCFQVLRNTIGNHYQRRRVRLQWTDTDPDSVERAASLEAMESHTTLSVIEDALEEMTRTDPQCGRYLSRLADGSRPRELAEDESVSVPVLSRRLYRCRRKLRDLLAEKGLEI